MTYEPHGTITAEDLEAARRDVATMERSPEAARKRLIEANVLTKDGKPRWPVEKPASARSNRRK